MFGVEEATNLVGLAVERTSEVFWLGGRIYWFKTSYSFV